MSAIGERGFRLSAGAHPIHRHAFLRKRPGKALADHRIIFQKQNAHR